MAQSNPQVCDCIFGDGACEKHEDKVAQSNGDELREQVQGMVYDKAIDYANGHVVDFYALADEVIELLAKDRKQHELEAKQARIEQSKSLCGCPMCLHHSEAFAIQAERSKYGTK